MDTWGAFHGALVGASITVFAVVFAVLQYRDGGWRGRGPMAGAVVAALGEAFTVLVASLIALMPGATPWRVGAIVASGLGIAALSTHWLLAWPALRAHTLNRSDDFQLWSSLFSLAVYGSLGASGIIGSAAWHYVAASLCVWLLFSGSSEAWILSMPATAHVSAEAAAVPGSDQ